MMLHRRILILGGARSGKSHTALALAERAALPRIFIATAQAFDDEMRERIRRHQDERGGDWQTCEAPIDLADAIDGRAAPNRVVVVDCLTLWLSNILLDGRDGVSETERLASAIHAARGPVILVSNEVGCGIVPATPLGRNFRDEQGRLNRRVAEICDAVIFVAAGCPLLLKPAPALDLSLQ